MAFTVTTQSRLEPAFTALTLLMLLFTRQPTLQQSSMCVYMTSC